MLYPHRFGRPCPTLCLLLFSSLYFLPAGAFAENVGQIKPAIQAPGQPDAAAAQQVNPDEYAIGRGFDSVSGTFRAVCVKETVTNLPKPENLGQSGGLILSEVKTVNDVANAFSLNASASYDGGVYSGDASASYARSTEINSYSSYLSVSDTVSNSRQLITHYSLNRTGLTAYKAGLIRFIQVCGDQWVAGKVTGGELLGIISATSKSEAEQVDAAAAFHAAGEGAEAAAAAKDKLNTFQSEGRLSIQVFRQGTHEPWPSRTPEELIEYARTFPEKVKPGSGNEITISWITSTYNEVFSHPEINKAQKEFLDVESEYLKDLYQERNDFIYLKDHNNDQDSEFGTTSLSKVLSRIDFINTEINRVKTASDGCFSDKNKCAPLTHISFDGTPQRADWTNVNVNINTYLNYFSVIAPDKKVLEIRGFWLTNINTLTPYGPDATVVRVIGMKDGTSSDFRYSHPVLLRPNVTVAMHIIDDNPGDNIPGRDPGNTDPLQTRVFTPVFPDDY